MACGLPGIAALQALVMDRLDAGNKDAFENQLRNRNLEQALSRVRRIEALLTDGGGEVDDLDAAAAGALDRDVCRRVVEQLTIPATNLEPMLRFASWAAQAPYDQPLELFTINYDLLLETALEELGVPYFDGFIGSLRARFRTDLVEATPRDSADWLPAFLVRLWKLHGSVNWEWEGERAEVVRLGTPVASGRPAAIYPSDAKYEESRRVPFVVLQDRLRRSLHIPETLVLISGYSWTDEHLNEMLFDAAKRRPRTEFVSFSYSALPDALLTRAETLPNVQAVTREEAIIGGLRAPWATTTSEAIPDVWDDGKCLLGDFRHLAALLARSSPSHGEIEQRVAELITKIASSDA